MEKAHSLVKTDWKRGELRAETRPLPVHPDSFAVSKNTRHLALFPGDSPRLGLGQTTEEKWLPGVPRQAAVGFERLSLSQ